MTVISDTQIVPRSPPSLPELRAADQGVADALESVLSNNTRRVYAAQWRLFNDWCDSVVLRSMPAEPLTVARYLDVRAGDGASIATLRWPRPVCAHDGHQRHAGTHRPAVRPMQAARGSCGDGGSFHRRWPRRCLGNFPGSTGTGS